MHLNDRPTSAHTCIYKFVYIQFNYSLRYSLALLHYIMIWVTCIFVGVGTTTVQDHNQWRKVAL